MADIRNLCPGCMHELPDGVDECPRCKYMLGTENSSEFLPVRTVLQNRYSVGKVLSFNGEGVTYLGYDAESDAPVRIREFFPSGMCERAGLNVRVFDDRLGAFITERDEFLKLARGLARMRNLSALLPVYDIFEENETAYYISETVELITLRDFLIRNGGSLSYEQVRPLFMPIMQTLSSLHAIGIIHRGISPDTLMIGKDGKMRLTEFCVPAARTARSEMAAHLFKGYAAVEQYGFDGEQGPWTDVYGLAATIYRALVGSPPPEATSRITNDKMIVPAAVADSLSAYVMSGLANALQILPADRTESIELFREEISASPNVVTRAAGRAASRADGESEPKKSANRTKYVIISMAATVAALLIVGVLVYNFLFKPGDQQPTTAPSPSATEFYSDNLVNFDNIQVPPLVGKIYADVIDDPEMKRYKIELSADETSTEEKGKIIRQEPKAGTTVNKNEVIKVVVSRGNQKSFKIPNIAGSKQFDAYDALVKAGVDPNLIKWQTKYSASYAPDAVVDISPTPGSEINSYTYVTVFLNSYRTTAPTTTEPMTYPPNTDAPEPSEDEPIIDE